MGKNNFELLKLAQSYLGKGGSTFRSFCGLPASAAWCNAFVCYIFAKGGDANLYYGGKKVTYCPTSIRWCQANLAQIPIYLALPMDVIYFDWEPNGVPNHIGFVRERKTDQEVYTIEGNTSGGIVAQKTRTVKYVCGCYRPHFKPTDFSANKRLDVDGYFGYNSIAVMQRWLGVTPDAILGKGTVKALQKRLGVAQDGSWGNKTSRALQKLIGTTVDGAFGAKSVKALQTYLNKAVFSVTASTPKVAQTKAQQISAKAVEYAWAKGTAESKYKKKGGSPTSAFKSAWKKYFPKDSINTGCHSYVNLVLKSCGYSGFPSYKWSDILSYLRKNFTELKVNYSQSQLKAGDIRVHKNSSGGYHIWVIVDIGGKLYRAEANQAGTNPRYAHINTSNSGNTKKHKGDWLFRAK